jgi:TRAP-type C4-dicarboxylate transport system permease large subunit
MAKEDIPNLGETLKKGWAALLLPLVIFVPFLLDNTIKPFFNARIGTSGASALSGCILLFTPGLAGLYALLISRKKANTSPKAIATLFSQQLKSIIPVTITIFFAYSVSNLFGTLGVGEAVGSLIKSLGLSHVALAFLIPLLCAILGMVLPGSSQVAIFGVTIITIMSNAGVNPFLIAGILPVITGAMEGMTPPLALCMYTAMGIAGSGMKETTINCLIWVGLHYILSVIILLGILPIIGLI